MGAPNVNAGEFKSLAGVDSIYLAEVLEDTSSAYSADTPFYLGPGIDAAVKPKTSQDTQYADNIAFDVINSEAETDFEVTFTNLPAETMAKILGKIFDATTGRIFDGPSTPPYFAIGYRSQKTNGMSRYYWFLKASFSAPEEALKTIGEKMEPQTIKLVAKAILTIHKWTVNSVTKPFKKVWGDEDTNAFSATNWFTQVQTPGTIAVSALALSSSVPANNATGASKTAAITLTFSNKLDADFINSVSLMDATPALVACTVTADVTGKILTMTHAPLTGTTDYTVVIAVKDIYGQTLNQLVKFTTAA